MARLSGFCFSRGSDKPSSAQNTANYAVNGGAVIINSATLRTVDGGASVILNVSGPWQRFRLRLFTCRGFKHPNISAAAQ